MRTSVAVSTTALLLACGCSGADERTSTASSREAPARVERAGVSLELPPGWRSADPDDGLVTDPVSLLAVSSGPIEHRARACQVASYRFPVDQVALVLVEWHDPRTRAPGARPNPITGRELPLLPDPAIECFTGPGGSIHFADQGRVFGAYLLLGPKAPRALADVARRVLGTLRVEPAETPSATLVPLAPKKLAHCRRSPLLREVCPRRVPRVRAPYLSHLATGLTGRVDPLHVFGLERGGEDPRDPRNNRPPRMGHLVVFAGQTDSIAAFDEPWGAPAAPLVEATMARPRTQPVSFGRVRWGDFEGLLYLAPPYLHGGVLGNHLVFMSWSGRTPIGISLHAWEPLPEAAATLRAVVESVPPN